MSCDIHDYLYIHNHLEEYEDILKKVEQDVQENIPAETIRILPKHVYDRGIQFCFYKYLLRHNMMIKPEKCFACPFLECNLSHAGTVFHTCIMNTDWFVGDLFFASHEGRPKWCPMDSEGWT